MKKLVFAVSAAALVAAAAPLDAASIYIGDDAAEGTAVTARGGTAGDTVTTLTYAFTGTTGTPAVSTTYTAPSAQNLTLTEVNLFAQGNTGSVTPFVARYNGANNQAGASYTVLAIGDTLSISGTAGPRNLQFTVGGLNPTIAVNSGDVIATGFYQTPAAIVRLTGSVTGTNVDYINNANSIPPSTGQTLTSDGDFTGAGFNRTILYNVGFNVVPEPSCGIAGLAGLTALGLRHRRRRAARPA